jgi:hypothetical protein
MPAKEEVGLRLGSESGRRKIMPYLLVRHKVEDYERWKPVFDHDHGATREQRGSKGGRILRNADFFNSLASLVDLFFPQESVYSSTSTEAYECAILGCPLNISSLEVTNASSPATMLIAGGITQAASFPAQLRPFIPYGAMHLVGPCLRCPIDRTPLKVVEATNSIGSWKLVGCGKP